MTALPARVRIRELGADRTVHRERQARLGDSVFGQPPLGRVTGLHLDFETTLPHVREIEVGWVTPGLAPGYRLPHDSTAWLAVGVHAAEAGTRAAQETGRRIVRDGAAGWLTASLGLDTWGIGHGRLDWRGEDLLVIERDVAHGAGWSLYVSVPPEGTFANCWWRVARMEAWVTEDLLPVLKATMEA